MLGFYNYTVILTYISLLSSMVGIYSAFLGNIELSMVLLFVSGICDAFDGKIARTKKDRTEDEKRFGIQIDSLCDLVCFSVFPSVIGFSIGVRSIIGIIVLCLYALTGVIRLAYFNVTEENRQQTTSEKRKVYLGLPVTFSAYIVTLFLHFRHLLGENLPLCYVILLVIMGILHLSPIKIRKPGK